MDRRRLLRAGWTNFVQPDATAHTPCTRPSRGASGPEQGEEEEEYDEYEETRRLPPAFRGLLQARADLLVRPEARGRHNTARGDEVAQVTQRLIIRCLNTAQRGEERLALGQLLRRMREGRPLKDVVVVVQRLPVGEVYGLPAVLPCSSVREELDEELERPTNPQVRHEGGVVHEGLIAGLGVDWQLRQEPLPIAAEAGVRLGPLELGDVRLQVAPHAAAHGVQKLGEFLEALQHRQTLQLLLALPACTSSRCRADGSLEFPQHRRQATPPRHRRLKLLRILHGRRRLCTGVLHEACGQQLLDRDGRDIPIAK
mmetsp:Transcript_59496/g.164566  ORF Transcript_59496/g.164566 Transcript_59496/m.164566 type:complete len:313 (+) Transcript_59496:118-1056(+)